MSIIDLEPDYRVADVPRMLLTYEQAGQAIGVSDKTIRALVADKSLPVVRVTPKNPRIDPLDLRAWIDSHKQSTTPPSR